MNRVALASLSKLLSPHVPLGKSRLETLCLLVLGVISARTVNLTHIAAERPTRAKGASTYRRLQRFFQQVALPEDWSVSIVMSLIGNPDRWYLFLKQFRGDWDDIPDAEGLAVMLADDPVYIDQGKAG